VRVEPAYAGGYVWIGKVEDHAGSSVFLSVEADAMTGSIRFDDHLFRVSYGGNGVHLVNELDESLFPGCATKEDYSVASPSDRDQGGTQSSTRAPIIDVMTVYSTVAKNSQGGANAMNSLINLAVSETNQSYTNSTINQRINLVHTQEMIGYVEPASFAQILNDLQGMGDGKLDEVHPLRNQYGADCVNMICNNSQYCGIANLMTVVSHNFENRAFAVVNRGCATGYYSYGHELGHLFGCAHDRQNAGGAAYSYAYGFRTSNNQVRTIMAYAPGTRVQWFSSPNSHYQSYTLGSATEDNARCMNNTASTAAGWRATATPPVLTVPALSAGAAASLDVSGCTVGGQVYLGYSLTGGGPLLTSFGTAALSMPVTLLPDHVANASGQTTFGISVPPGAAGRTVWFQALDVARSSFSNGEQTTIN